ncbi:Conserved_hypothetical protein [Hexamita inflata]|uniref:Transmembrane protein n=1 Tax=Hexamita inflata TaxID=28002 RepID=A0AA86N4N5_9EUKA|nr:Conserved hypothetical protein [Hexamita inflata]
MFEAELNCNPMTDHIQPKNVFTVFKEAILNVLNSIVLESQNNSKSLIYNDIYKLLKQEIDQRVEAQQLLSHYQITNNVYLQYNKYLTEQIENMQQQFSTQSIHQKQHLLHVKQQLESKNLIYKADQVQTQKSGDKQNEQESTQVQQLILDQLVTENKKYIYQITHLTKIVNELQEQRNNLQLSIQIAKQKVVQIEHDKQSIQQISSQQQKEIIRLQYLIETNDKEHQNKLKQQILDSDREECLIQQQNDKINEEQKEQITKQQQIIEFYKLQELEIEQAKNDVESQYESVMNQYSVIKYQELQQISSTFNSTFNINVIQRTPVLKKYTPQFHSIQNRKEDSNIISQEANQDGIFDIEHQLIQTETEYQQLQHINNTISTLVETIVEASVQTDSYIQDDISKQSSRQFRQVPTLVAHFQPSDTTLGNIAVQKANEILGKNIFERRQPIKSLLDIIKTKQEQAYMRKQQIIQLIKQRYQALHSIALVITGKCIPPKFKKYPLISVQKIIINIIKSEYSWIHYQLSCLIQEQVNQWMFIMIYMIIMIAQIGVNEMFKYQYEVQCTSNQIRKLPDRD